MVRAIVNVLLQPWVIAHIVVAIGLMNLWRRRVEKRGRLLLVSIPFAILFMVSMPAMSHFAYGSLEWAYPEHYERPPGADAIVVLGGWVSPPTEFRPTAILGLDSMKRCIRAADLYHQGKACPVIVTGGKPDADVSGPPVAEAMADFLRRHGVAENDLIIEARSRNTYENALHTKELVQPRGIRNVILVTEAIHLRRAESCFRKQGFRVLPSGCDYRASKFHWSITTFLPNPYAALGVEGVLHEWLGLAVYRVRGWI